MAKYNTSNHTQKDEDFVHLDTLMQSLLKNADLMQTYATLRNAIIENDNDNDINDAELILAEKSERPLIDEASLAPTQRGMALKRCQGCRMEDTTAADEKTKQAKEDDSCRYLKHDVTAKDVYYFVRNNQEFVRNLNLSKEQENKDILKLAEEFKSLDCKVVEFDDQACNSDIVYGITVNRTDQRIDVFFQGGSSSANDDAMDATVDKVGDKKKHGEIKVHGACLAYLNAKLCPVSGAVLPKKRMLQKQRPYTSKFGDIEKNLKTLLDQYPEFRVCVSGGHDMGGALAELLVFQLAHSGSLKAYKLGGHPLTAITYNAPEVGNEAFYLSWDELEEQDMIRHIMASTQEAEPRKPKAAIPKDAPTQSSSSKNKPMTIWDQDKARKERAEQLKALKELEPVDPVGYHAKRMPLEETTSSRQVRFAEWSMVAVYCKAC